MATEKMLSKAEEKKNMLVTIAMHKFDMLRGGIDIPPELDTKNKQLAKEYTIYIDNKGLTVELYNRIMAGLV